jgi:serine/threonine-protein kinase
LAALLWFGFQLPDRLRNLSEGDPTATVEAEATASNAPTSAAAEPTSPAIVPNETDESDVVSVPDIRNRTVDDANLVLEPLGLSIEQTGETPSDSVPVGQIVNQQPGPGSNAQPGSSIQVTVSSGPGSVNLQEMRLFGLEADQAQSLLESQGLTVERVDQASSDVPEGAVIDTDPSDEAQPGDTVTMFVSVGNKVQIPPEIQGSPLSDAVTKLDSLGFEITDQIGVSRQHIENFGVDLQAAGIVDQDVVGIQNDENTASFGAWLPPGSSISVVYYDESLNESG